MINSAVYSRKQKKDLIKRLAEETTEDSNTCVEQDGRNKDSQSKHVSKKDSRKTSVPRTRSSEILENDESAVLGSNKKLAKTVLVVTVLLLAVTAVYFLSVDNGHRGGFLETRYLGTLPPEAVVWSYDVPLPVPVERCVLSDTEFFPVIDAERYEAVFVASGQSIFRKNGDEQISIASIIKLLGALVVVDEYNLDSKISLLEEVNVEGNGMDLTVGEVVSVEDLLAAALIGSKNDAMYALAQNYYGGQDAFVASMNRKAEVIGLQHTNVSNPVGYDSPDQYSTMDDIFTLIIVAMRDPKIASILGSKQWIVDISSGRQVIRSTNRLLGTVDGVVGGKTGFTSGSGLSLVEYVADTQDFVTVVLGAEDRFEASAELIDAVRRSYVCR